MSCFCFAFAKFRLQGWAKSQLREHPEWSALELRLKRRCIALLEPGDKCIARLVVRGGRTLKLAQADAGEGHVIHLRRARDTPLVFEMAIGAGGDVGVESAGLTLEE